jgi:hypothetical protein
VALSATYPLITVMMGAVTAGGQPQMRA